MLTDPAILERVFEPTRGSFPAEVAREFLKFTLSAKDRARYTRLSYKAQAGKLTPAERVQLEDYLNVNDFLMILKAKAQASLRGQHPAA